MEFLSILFLQSLSNSPELALAQMGLQFASCVFTAISRGCLLFS
jgi:hypothetical protein